MPLLTRRMHLSGVWPGRVKSCPAVAVWQWQFGGGSLAAAVRQWQSGGRVGRKGRTGEPGGAVGSGRDVDPAAWIGRGIGRAVRIEAGRAARRDSLDERRGPPDRTGQGRIGRAAQQAGSNGRRSGYSTGAAVPTFSGSSSAGVSAPGRAADSAGCALDWACCSCHRWGVSPFSLAKAR